MTFSYYLCNGKVWIGKLPETDSRVRYTIPIIYYYDEADKKYHRMVKAD